MTVNSIWSDTSKSIDQSVNQSINHQRDKPGVKPLHFCCWNFWTIEYTESRCSQQNIYNKIYIIIYDDLFDSFKSLFCSFNVLSSKSFRKFSPRCAACQKLILPENVNIPFYFYLKILCYVIAFSETLWKIEASNFSTFRRSYCRCWGKL